jgi:Arc/MetJ family transcription regulator
MRTNIVIDDTLMETAKRESGLSTKRAIVEAALEALIREQRRRRLNAAFGRYVWEGDLAKMREGSPLDRMVEEDGSEPRERA